MPNRKEPVISGDGASIASDIDQTLHADGRSRVTTRLPPKRASVLLPILLALIAIGASGFSYWSLTQRDQTIIALEKELLQNKTQLHSLEQRLALADGESTESLSALRVVAKENSAEIRKLWGVSNDRNKKAIAELKASLEAFKGEQLKSFKQLESNLTKIQVAFDGLNSGLGELKTDVALFQDLQEGLQQMVEQARKATADQAQEIGRAQQSMADSLTSMQSKLDKQQEAVSSIDAFRKQINREILALKQRQ